MKNKKTLRKKSAPSICLTTYFDKNFEKMGKICLITMKKYAEKYGYDLKLHNEIKTSRPAPWKKVLLIQKLLSDSNNYDFVLFIDSDALFVRFNEDLRKEIKPGKDLYLVKHDFNKTPNTGFMLVRNTSWSRDFFRKVWNKKQYIYHNLWENAAVSELLGCRQELSYDKYRIFLSKILYKLGCKHFITKLFGKFKIWRIFVAKSTSSSKMKKFRKADLKILKKIKFLNKKWNNLPDLDKISNSIVNHYPAIPYAERLKKMNSDAHSFIS